MSLAFPQASSISDNGKAALLMVGAMGAFAFNDAIVKQAMTEISTAQLLTVRSTLASMLLLALAAFRGELRGARAALRLPVIVRSLADIGATLAYINALIHLPLANASAIYQALPLVVTLGAVIFLGERPGWRRWSSIALGFVGVMIIIRPGTDGFTVHSISVLLSVAFSALRDLVTRRLPANVPSVFVSTVTAISVGLVGFILLPFQGWQPMTPTLTLSIVAAACAISLGYIAIVAAMRLGEVGFVTPFRYTILVFATILGFVFFGDAPALLDVVGAAIVVASGVFVFARERRLGRLAPLRNQVH
ncbi:DMT family transporter [Aureimonas mangrovi]|uniref:DMT family transporter n=1 Tax=Aureimonas mangrovi TaxID=2758041 RepID=UPI001FE2E233|nr:DMT family transporter [Aureimonas mangrovi]